jgi:predicted DsbA family dithiol-disulfide isomerase
LPLLVDIEIWSDLVCPWCYIGKRRLERAVAGLDATVTFRAYQLDPTPVPAPEPLLVALAAKFGGPERARTITDRTRAVAAADGLELNFDRAVAANTFDAHRLVRWAADQGRQADMVEALHRAHFTDGVDIGSRAALAEVAGSLGLDAAAYLASDAGTAGVRADITTAHEFGISSVPTFVVDRRYAIVGAQEVDVLRGALDRILATAG